MQGGLHAAHGSVAGTGGRGLGLAAGAGKKLQAHEEQDAEQQDVHDAATGEAAAEEQGADERTGQKAAEQATHTAEEALALGLLGLGRLLALLRGLALHGAGGLGGLRHGRTAAEGTPPAQTGRIGGVGQGIHTGASQHDEHGQDSFDLH